MSNDFQIKYENGGLLYLEVFVQIGESNTVIVQKGARIRFYSSEPLTGWISSNPRYFEVYPDGTGYAREDNGEVLVTAFADNGTPVYVTVILQPFTVSRMDISYV